MDIIPNSEIILKPQKRITVDGGDVLQILKSNEKEFRGFQEAYLSIIKNNYIKAWKRHLKMTMNLVVPIGKVKFIFYDCKGNLLLNETIGEENYCRLTVPPNIWFGFKGLSKKDSYVFNIANIKHDPKEVERKSLEEFTFI